MPPPSIHPCFKIKLRKIKSEDDNKKFSCADNYLHPTNPSGLNIESQDMKQEGTQQTHDTNHRRVLQVDTLRVEEVEDSDAYAVDNAVE